MDLGQGDTCGGGLVRVVFSVCSPWQVPVQFRPPAPEALPAGVVVQVVQHEAVVISAVLVHCHQLLHGVGELEHIPDVNLLVDVPGTADLGIMSHDSILGLDYNRNTFQSVTPLYPPNKTFVTKPTPLYSFPLKLNFYL